MRIALTRLSTAAALAVASVALVAAPASAQATRTWVSGVGDDANPCSQTAPCKTFAGAISKTAAGGTIDALDDAGYGGLTITKAITIDGGGHVAGALVAGASAFVVNAGPADDVTIRGVAFEEGSAGSCTPNLSAIRVLQADSVVVEDSTIRDFDIGVDLSHATASVDLSVTGTSLRNVCTTALDLAPPSPLTARASIDDTTVTGSGAAVAAGPGATAYVQDSTFTTNTVALTYSGGVIHSLCGNSIAGNDTASSFTDELGCSGTSPGTGTGTGTATPTPVPPATPVTTGGGTVVATYCTIPSLRGRSATQAAAALTSAGCALGKATKKRGGAKKVGKVLLQGIPAGTQVKPGTVVTVVVGKK